MSCRTLKNYTEEEIIVIIRKALEEIKETDDGYGVIRIEISGWRVKFINVEKSVKMQKQRSR